MPSYCRTTSASTAPCTPRRKQQDIGRDLLRRSSAGKTTRCESFFNRLRAMQSELEAPSLSPPLSIFLSLSLSLYISLSLSLCPSFSLSLALSLSFSLSQTLSRVSRGRPRGAKASSAACEQEGVELRVENLASWVQGLGSRVQGSGFRVQVSEFWFRVEMKCYRVMSPGKGRKGGFSFSW